MYIIDKTYFVKELTIPNINEMNSDILVELNRYIDQDVRVVLQNALGMELFEEFDSFITSGGTLSISADTKWQNLVTGTTYTATTSGEVIKWKGLIYKEGILPQSLLTGFVYYDWLSNNQTFLAGSGEKVVSAQNALNANSTQRATKVWNKFVLDYQGDSWTHAEPKKYWNRFNIPVLDWSINHYNKGYASLLQFLIDNKEDYPNANLFKYQIKNQLGI